jgi:hypothetical protein
VIYAIERHYVMGEQATAFEEAYRDVYLPRLGDTSDARLMWYTQSPHGSGEAYYDVTVTAFPDVPAWERWAERMRRGDLADFLEAADSRRYSSEGSLVTDLPWSPLAAMELPFAEPGASVPHLLRLETYEAEPGIFTQSFDTKDHLDRPFELVGAFAPLLGLFQRRVVLVLYRMGDHASVVKAISEDDGTTAWPGALDVGPSAAYHVESRVLRTTEWSPLS